MSWRLSYDISTSIHTFASWSVSDTCCSPNCPHPGKMTGKINKPLLLTGIGHIPHPPYTNAALPTEKPSPSSGRQAGGYLVRFTRSSVIKWTFKMKKREVHLRVFKSTFQRCAWNELTKFQECNVIHMSWKVIMNNDFAHSDMFPAQKGKILKTWDIWRTF